MNVVLTIDVEDWYHTNGFNFDPKTWNIYDDRVVANTRRLLDIFDEGNAKGTFFILGDVANRHPELVLEIHRRGHEIGCHGWAHKMVNHHAKEVILEDIRSTKVLLESIIGKSVLYYRAPSWSMDQNTLWLFEELISMGFTCDSSIQPFNSGFSGYANSPTKPFIPVIDHVRLNLTEFPATVLSFGPMRVPFSGGFYARMLPYWVFDKLLAYQSNKGPVMFYCHPWEYDINAPRLSRNFLQYMLHYFNVHSNEKKLRRLIASQNCIPLGECLKRLVLEEVPLARS